METERNMVCIVVNRQICYYLFWPFGTYDHGIIYKEEYVLRCFFLADILQHYEQANVGSLKATKCKLQRAYAGHGGHIAQMPRWPREANVELGWTYTYY